MMKTATTPFADLDTASSEDEQSRPDSSGWAKYAVVFALLLLASASFAWLPGAHVAAGVNLGTGFLAFWVMGAVVTITLVALSGRSKT